MDYKKELQKSWERDNSYQKLESISFNEVGIRGVKNITIELKYPITAIAGANGIGKTTILQTLACLFHNNDLTYIPYRFTVSKTQLPYYTFADFFIITRGEDKGLGAILNFEFKKTGITKTNYVIKKISRWGNYERRPNRHVDFLGISRVLPAYEFAYFRYAYAGSYTANSRSALSSIEQQTVANITGKNLTSVTEEGCAKIQNFKLSKIESEGVNYTSFNMGAGEEVAITLISRINKMPVGSFILIEELELGLHPKAQKNLLESLFKIVYDKKIQLIFTTHSPYLFDMLPSNAKILLKKTCNELKVIYEPSNSLAFIELTGEDQRDLTVYVEDEIAKQLIEGLFNFTISKRIAILDVGSKENVVRMTSAHYINPELGMAIGIPDGDVSEVDIKKWCAKYMFCNTEVPADNEYLSSYFTKLPSNIAPEKYLLSKLKSDNEFIRNIDNSDEFVEFIQNQIDISTDHHALFFKISQFLSKDIEGIKRDIIRYIIKTYNQEFDSITTLVNEKLR